jgi:hypothetical protein
MDTTRTDVATNRTRGQRLLGAGMLALLAGGLLVACSDDDSSDEASGTTFTKGAPTTEAPASDTTLGESAGPGSTVVVVTPPADGGGASGGGQTGGGSSGGGQAGTPTPSTAPAPTTTAPTSPPPVITGFTTPESIDCHNGDFQEFTASWTTTNAVKVTISIDGPGVYDEYPANGSTSLPFSCSSSHTFLLTAHGAAGQTAAKSITLQPRNVQAPAGPEADDL